MRAIRPADKIGDGVAVIYGQQFGLPFDLLAFGGAIAEKERGALFVFKLSLARCKQFVFHIVGPVSFGMVDSHKGEIVQGEN